MAEYCSLLIPLISEMNWKNLTWKTALLLKEMIDRSPLTLIIFYGLLPLLKSLHQLRDSYLFHNKFSIHFLYFFSFLAWQFFLILIGILQLLFESFSVFFLRRYQTLLNTNTLLTQNQLTNPYKMWHATLLGFPKYFPCMWRGQSCYWRKYWSLLWI